MKERETVIIDESKGSKPDPNSNLLGSNAIGLKATRKC
jgi:hypothetical protein